MLFDAVSEITNSFQSESESESESENESSSNHGGFSNIKTEDQFLECFGINEDSFRCTENMSLDERFRMDRKWLNNISI